MDELRVSKNAFNVDVIIITESWLQDTVADELLHMKNCDFFRCDRKFRKGGGVCTWINQKFCPKRLMPVSEIPSCIELIFVRVHCVQFFMICCALYIPPGLCKREHDCISHFLTVEFDHLLTFYPMDKLMFTGDLNDFPTSFFRENFNLINRVTEATRKTAVLDQIWIDEELSEHYPNKALVGPPLKNSDHNSIVLLPQNRMDSGNSCHLALVWDFRSSNIAEFLRRLSSVNH